MNPIWKAKSKAFTFPHAIIWAYPQDKREEVKDVRGSSVNRVNEEGAEITLIPQPFGMHVVVSAFDGENQYSLQTTGGHQGHVVVTHQQVDSPIEVLNSGYKATEEDYNALMDSWYNWMPDGLRNKVKEIMEDLGGFLGIENIPKKENEEENVDSIINGIVDRMVDSIKENGFMIAMQLFSAITESLRQVSENEEIVTNKSQYAYHILDLLAERPGIHRVEYTNNMVEEYRVKDLFYYNPNI